MRVMRLWMGVGSLGDWDFDGACIDSLGYESRDVGIVDGLLDKFEGLLGVEVKTAVCREVG